MKREKAGGLSLHQPCPCPAEAGQSLNLLEFSSAAGFFQLLLDVFGFFLGSTFLDGGRSAVNQALGFFQAQAGYCAYYLDDVNFLVTGRSQNNIKFGLLFSSTASVAASSCRRSCNSSSGSYTELT